MINVRQTNSTNKLQRIDLRTTEKIKRTLMQAAELVGISMSTFLLEAAYEKAQNLIKSQETLQLSDEERDRFLAILDKPANPNAKLRKAMRNYLSHQKTSVKNQ